MNHTNATEVSLPSLVEAAKEALKRTPNFLWGSRVRFIYYGSTRWGARWDNLEDGWKFTGHGDSPDEAEAWLEYQIFRRYAPWHARIV